MSVAYHTSTTHAGATMEGQRRYSESLTARVRVFLNDNPEAALSQADIVRQFGCTRGAANSAIYNLLRRGVSRDRFIIRARGPNADLRAAFPDNLTSGERRAIEAYADFGTFKGAARKLGVSEFTIGDQLKRAREKAEVHESVVLVARYIRATHRELQP